MSLIYDALKEQVGPASGRTPRAPASWWARQSSTARAAMLAGGIVLPVMALAYLTTPAAKPLHEPAPVAAAGAGATAIAAAPVPAPPVAVDTAADVAPLPVTPPEDATASELPPITAAALTAAIETPAPAAVQEATAVATVPALEPVPAAIPATEPMPAPPAALASVPAQPQPISIKVERHTSSGGERRHEADDAQVARNVATLEAAMAHGDLPAARQALAQLDALLPGESLTLLRMQAWIAHAGNDTGSAEKLYRRIVERVPDDINAGVNIALLDARRGELDDAHQRLTRLSGRYPRSPQIARALAELDGQRQ